MLRGRVSRQPKPSVCVFCQHRLSLRLARTPRRLLSSTRPLCDDNSSSSQSNDVPGSQTPPAASGWGRPAFGAFAGQAQSAQSLFGDGLLPHEIAARQRLKEQAERAAKKAHEPPPKPHIKSRFPWDTEKQKEIEKSVDTTLNFPGVAQPLAPEILRRDDFPRRNKAGGRPEGRWFAGKWVTNPPVNDRQITRSPKDWNNRDSPHFQSNVSEEASPFRKDSGLEVQPRQQQYPSGAPSSSPRKDIQHSRPARASGVIRRINADKSASPADVPDAPVTNAPTTKRAIPPMSPRERRGLEDTLSGTPIRTSMSNLVSKPGFFQGDKQQPKSNSQSVGWGGSGASVRTKAPELAKENKSEEWGSGAFAQSKAPQLPKESQSAGWGSGAFAQTKAPELSKENQSGGRGRGAFAQTNVPGLPKEIPSAGWRSGASAQTKAPELSQENRNRTAIPSLTLPPISKTTNSSTSPSTNNKTSPSPAAPSDNQSSPAHGASSEGKVATASESNQSLPATATPSSWGSFARTKAPDLQVSRFPSTWGAGAFSGASPLNKAKALDTAPTTTGWDNPKSNMTLAESLNSMNSRMPDWKPPPPAQSSSSPTSDTRLRPEPSADETDKLMSTTISGSGSPWGSLARKPTPSKRNSEVFWASIDSSFGRRAPQTSKSTNGNRQGRNDWTATTNAAQAQESQRPSMQDWGTEFDKNPRSSIYGGFREKMGQYDTRSSARPRQDSSRDYDRRPKDSIPIDSPAVIPEQPAPIVDEALKARVNAEEIEREKRALRWEQEQESRKVKVRGKKRGGRASRYEDEEDGYKDFEEHNEEDEDGGRSAPRGRQRSSRQRNEDEDTTYDRYDAYLEKKRLKAERKAQREAELTSMPIILPELISISDLAKAMKIENQVFLSQLAELGFEDVSLDSIMAGETAALVAQEYGYEPTVDTGSDDLKPRPPPEDPSVLPPRPPVITIMGHVDHGKTTLLDYLRQSSIVTQEHGGITQHIGAFSVKLSEGKQITFLDTPGHAAFLTMRQRGANVTDIVILVVAADDSVMPQTREAIKHAREAKVPMIVAVNKIDKEGSNIDRVKQDLATAGVEIEDFGGDVQVVYVSGKTGQGMDDLEENILLLSEILDMRAEQDGMAEGWILESSVKTVGRAATILVKRGTLRPGDIIAAGTTWAKIRHLRNEAGFDIAEAPPGTPVEVLGWKDLPAAGDQVLQAPDERAAQNATDYREGLRKREKDAADQQKIAEQRRLVQEKRAAEKAEEESNDERKRNKRTDGTWGTIEQLPAEENGVKVVNFVVKGDVHGSVEAVSASILEIGSNEVRPRVLRSSPGHITEGDVEHAATSKSTIINFNLPVNGGIKSMAEEQGVKIIDDNVIYRIAEDVKNHLSKYLAPDISTQVLGEAEVLEVFPINIKGRMYKKIAGCRIRNGRLAKNDLFRVVRKGVTIHQGKIESLKYGKKDAMEAGKGDERGIGFEDFQDWAVGDQIQAWKEVRTERTL